MKVIRGPFACFEPTARGPMGKANSMSDLAPRFDDRESFRVAEAVLAVVRQLCGQFSDDDAVWEAFIEWRGRGEGEYLRRIRAGGKYVFYSVLQDLYQFAEETCGESVARAVGRQLAESLLARHLPDLLQSTLGEATMLPAQIMWLINQFLAGTCGEIYRLEVEADSDDNLLAVVLTYAEEKQMADSLASSGHDAQVAFANSFNVFRGALGALLGRVVCGFAPEQFHTELRALRGRGVIELRPANRFHYENIIDLLLEYVRRLRLRQEDQPQPVHSEAKLHASTVMKATWQAVCKASACDETVLLCGESGTGKSYHARLIHEMSTRRDGPFVEVGLVSDVGSDNLVQSNLFGHVRGAFTGADDEKQGLFALAHGGTIFLDEIGDASAELQAKLLRVIESKSFKKLGGVQEISVDVRIVAATNRDLAAMVAQGGFRADLYYRLNVIQILLPPLRQRAEDVPALVGALFDRICRDGNKQGKHLTGAALRSLCGHDWPGNIRELENALRRAVAFSEQAEVDLDDLPGTIRGPVAAPPAAGAGREEGLVIDPHALRHVLSSDPSCGEAESFEWPGHIDYAKRMYLRALIEHENGDLREIAKHWDRSSEHTLLKLVRQFGLEDELQAARKKRK